MNMTTAQGHLDWLQDRLAAYESKLSEAEATVARLRPVVANLRGTIEALTSEERGPLPPQDLFGEQRANGAKAISVPTVPTPTVISVPTRVPGKPFAQGNQNPAMPARRPEFAATTLIDAASRIVDNATGAIHADDVTRAVFNIETKAQFTLAKQSMASELYRGAKKGLWEFLGENTYKRK